MTAVEALCACPKQYSIEEHAIKLEEQDIVDLSLDEVKLQDTMQPPLAFLLGQQKAEAGPSSIKIENTSGQPCGDLSFLAWDHTHAELHELLECLSLEELRRLAKDMKIRKTSLNVSSSESRCQRWPALKILVASGNRGLADQTGVLSINSTISFSSAESKGSKAACKNTITFR